jgi:nucleoside-diphosphate-sugar epimerase
VPVGLAGVRPHSWRKHQRLRTEGVATVVRAARAAGVRRFVQESLSLLYADQGDRVVTESSPLAITPATEPAAVAELHVQEYQRGPRTGVVLRFGTIIGDDPFTGWRLHAARNGRPVVLGSPAAWSHPVHTDDLGPAVLAALIAPSGFYNVGAEPVRRATLVRGFQIAAGHPVHRDGRRGSGFPGPVRKRLVSARLEPLTRSLRVSSEHFTAQTGWTPRRARFDASWFDVIRDRQVAEQAHEHEASVNEIPDPVDSPVDVPAPRPVEPARSDARREAARRRRLAEVFGDVLPSTTGDERGGADHQEAGRDAWLRSQVPPHHGPTR